MSDPLEAAKHRFEVAKFAIAAVAAIAVFSVGLWQFMINSRNELAQPFFQKQLDLCVEVSEAAALIATKRTLGSDKPDPVTVFLANYWGKLGMVEDDCLSHAMINFYKKVIDPAEREDSQAAAEQAALRVAYACRRLVSGYWDSGFVNRLDPLRFGVTLDNSQYQDTIRSCAKN